MLAKMWKKGNLYIVSGNVSWCSHYGKQYGFLKKLKIELPSVQFSSVSQSCLTLCDPMNRSTPGLPVHHQLPEFTQTRVHRVSDPSNHLILCRPLLLLPPIPPSIRVFSNESTLTQQFHFGVYILKKKKKKAH